jgi:hypothetical protein
VVCLEKEKKKSFAMELVLQHFLLSIYTWLLKFWDLPNFEGSSHYLNGFILGPYLFKD